MKRTQRKWSNHVLENNPIFFRSCSENNLVPSEFVIRKQISSCFIQFAELIPFALIQFMFLKFRLGFKNNDIDLRMLDGAEIRQIVKNAWN